MEKNTHLTKTFLIMAAFLLAGSIYCVIGHKVAADEMTITDLAGREITLNVPVERVVLASGRHLHEFAAVAGKDFLNNIVGWGPDLHLYDQDTYDTYLEKIPQIADVPDVGYHYKGTFSVEKVISLKPEAVILPLWLVDQEGVQADIEKLELAGIPSIYIDYYTAPFEHPVESTLLLGVLLGKEERAQEIADFYLEQVNTVYARLQEMSAPQPTVYVEVGSKGPSTYGNTYANVGWGAVASKSGGANIAEGIIENSGAINPEYLLKSNPDVIILSGSYWPATSDSLRLGYHATPEESQRLLKTFTERPGWETLDAVKNARVHGIFHGFSFRIYNFAGIQAFAKWLYPDEFQDVDPVGTLQEFHERFMPVEYSGVWMISLEE